MAHFKSCIAMPAIALLLDLISAAALAADDNPKSGAALTGVIQDQSGAAIATANVKLTPKSGGTGHKATTDENGHFEFATLPEGEYLLSASAPGVEEGEIKVKVGPSPGQPIRLRLAIAELREEVTVTADDFSKPSVQSNTDVATFGRDYLANLPSRDGNPLAVPSLLINPALNGTGGPKILVDGVEASSLDQPESSIRHVYVNKNPFAAEFGRPGKGRIEATTVRGRRKYRGSLSSLLGNSALDARNAFATTRPLQQRSISEAALDGPIIPGARHASFSISGRHEAYNQSSVIAAQTLQGPFVANVVAPERNTYLFGRLNFKAGQLSHLSASYKFKDKSRENQGVKGFNLPERATDRLDQENEAKVLFNSIPGGRFINEIRAAFRHRNQSSIGSTNQPATIVLGAFHAGGAQVAERQRDTMASFEDIASLNRGKHTLRFGGGIRPRFLWVQDASNFGGTFSFSSLSDFAQQKPFLFTQSTGNPATDFSQHETYAFLQDDIRVRPNLSVVPGIRHEWQSNGNSLKNIAPRLALAWSPGGQPTVLRAGVGIFYDRQSESMERQRLLEDGVRIQKIVITDPVFFFPSPIGLLPNVIPSVVRIAPGIRFPYLIQGSLGVERKLPAQNQLSVEYSTVRGLKLYRMRNINAPLPGSPVRPDPGFVNIEQFESSGSSRGNSLAVTLQNRRYKGLSLMGQYTLSRTTDDTSGMSSLPANNYDLRPERGRADFDQRHRLLLLGTYSAFWGMRLGGVLQFSSGSPFDVTTGFDNNHDSVANDRPVGVHRNSGQGPGFTQLDMRLSKVMKFEKPGSLQAEIAADFFNVLNHVNYSGFVGTLTSPFFGRANSAYSARQIQLSFRLKF
jgi:carboxypeptidase family protein